jgi:hypothetical protein
MEAAASPAPAIGAGQSETTLARVGRVAITIFVALTGVAIFLVGAVDFLGGQQIDARILGALNLVAGAVWVATAIGFRYRTIITLGIVVAGALLGVAFAIYFGWQWWRFGHDDAWLWRITIWMGVLAAAIGVVLARTWHDYGITEQTKRRFAAGRIGIPILATLGVLGALFQFWYNAAYGPSALPPNLVVEAHLRPAGERADTGMRAYSVDIDISNAGESRVQVLASWYNLATLDALDPDEGETLKANIDGSFSRLPYILEPQPHRAERNVVMSMPRPVAAGELLSRGWWFEPGESSHIQFLTYVDPLEGDVLHLGVDLDIARGHRLELDEEPATFECAADPQPIDVMGWQSAEPAAIREATTPKIRVVYGWQTAEDGTLVATACYGVNDRWYGLSDGGPTDDVLKVLEQEYGLAQTGAETQVSLWPGAEATPSP